MPQHPRVYATEAIILRRTDFGEADRILTLFTPSYGKVRAIAKGVAPHDQPARRPPGALHPHATAAGHGARPGYRHPGGGPRTARRAARDALARDRRLVRRRAGGSLPRRRRPASAPLSPLRRARCACWTRAARTRRQRAAGWRCATSSCTCWTSWATGPRCTPAPAATRRCAPRRTATAPSWAARSARLRALCPAPPHAQRAQGAAAAANDRRGRRCPDYALEASLQHEAEGPCAELAALSTSTAI